MCVKQAPRIGQLDTTPVAMKQCRIQFILQLSQLMTERGLGNEDLLSRL